ncbi:argininosuccinate lyase [Jejuia pallidilutea]|uniref:Argininosuccinate lyase n=1 Tax=Jejuia pallidilutea TaxID=504487 RepID=A0A090WUL3_9FLAO|nr:argininosuccinate lyase [Jejuia pallidilutea]GAL66135.1 argininosuccinate lyase [Jejuia pallidilutea]GAL71082.1 argininosuccinate lyase [Jejuia pallidilutea]GAL88167.1 argininosuccinate lyase [Jejuia pallidilutea]
MKLWDKGISIDKKIEQFTVGNDREIDIHIAKYDVIASKAHAKMLESIGILTSEELEKLLGGLDILANEIETGTFEIEAQFEDVHSKIEFELTKSLGDVGKKIHTARSRNDQVLVACHLYYKENLKLIQTKTKTLFDTLLDLAETYKDKVLPGYTHLQVAMPSSFGLWFSAYAELMIDDVYLLNAALKTVDQNPLGSAAGYGSSFPIDRELTTKAMGFTTLKYNVVAAQMGRGKNERTIAAAFGSLCNTLSRFAMDVCLYMSQNFNFVSFPDELTTGSSIMPHKKNPDVFELIRGKCNKIQALQTEMILITNNLPSGYHRDFQLLKENIIAAFEDLKDILDVFNFSIQQIIVKDVDIHDDKYKYLFTVDNINTLVVEGQTFREAYQKIGGQVQDGTYVPDTSKKHTHLGSIHNLSLDKIRDKFPS